MLLGCAHVSKTDGSQSLEPATRRSGAAGVDDAVNLYPDFALRDARPGSRQLPARPDGRVTCSWWFWNQDPGGPFAGGARLASVAFSRGPAP